MSDLANNVEVLKPRMTDKEMADDLRSRLLSLLREVCTVMDEARAAGLNGSFQLGTDPYGRSIIQSLNIVKPL